MYELLLIHYDNTPLLEKFPNSIKFNPSTEDLNNSDIDTFISKQIIPQLQDRQFDILCIKDTLSENYIDFYGLILAHHVRLSRDLLKDKSLVPIIILSDINELMINKLSSFGRLFFTKNTFLCKNNVKSVEDLLSFDLKPLTEEEYENSFIRSIRINPPQDYLSHHSIANEWAIDQWATALGVETDTIKNNRAKIETMLYFKYLKARYSNRLNSEKTLRELIYKGKVLLIDDEWNRGWRDILEKALSRVELYNFEENFKDKNNIDSLDYTKLTFFPDVVILDLRLFVNDHKKQDMEGYGGVMMLEKLHQINPGIQIIMFTATSKSTILDRLHEKQILGYIKKEHPDDITIDTMENINKLVGLVDRGLERSYLIKVWNIQQKILELQIFKLSDTQNEFEEIKAIIFTIFHILNSTIQNPFHFALLQIHQCFEGIAEHFIYEKYNKDGEKKNKAYWRDTDEIIGNIGNTSVSNKINSLFIKLGMDDTMLSDVIEELACSRNKLIHPGNTNRHCEGKVIEYPDQDHIIEWFKMLQKILEKIDQTYVKSI